MSRKKQRTQGSFEQHDEEETPETSKKMVNVGAIVTSTLFSVPIWHEIDKIEQKMSDELSKMFFPSEIKAIYNPLTYARAMHCEFMSKYLVNSNKIEFLFVGMNPGPFGMVQTSVPFGNISTVRDWFKLTSEVDKPTYELPQRPVEGLKCTKEEQSGKRWWSLIRDVCETPEQFFKHCFVYNYCPLAFFAAGGVNVTPSELKGESRARLQETCNSHLVSVVKVLQPKTIISIGKYADDRVKSIQKRRLIEASICCKCIPHPSPRSVNNQDWPIKARRWFEENGVLSYLQKS